MTIQSCTLNSRLCLKKWRDAALKDQLLLSLFSWACVWGISRKLLIFVTTSQIFHVSNFEDTKNLMLNSFGWYFESLWLIFLKSLVDIWKSLVAIWKCLVDILKVFGWYFESLWLIFWKCLVDILKVLSDRWPHWMEELFLWLLASFWLGFAFFSLTPTETKVKTETNFKVYFISYSECLLFGHKWISEYICIKIWHKWMSEYIGTYNRMSE